MWFATADFAVVSLIDYLDLHRINHWTCFCRTSQDKVLKVLYLPTCETNENRSWEQPLQIYRLIAFLQTTWTGFLHYAVKLSRISRLHALFFQESYLCIPCQRRIRCPNAAENIKHTDNVVLPAWNLTTKKWLSGPKCLHEKRTDDTVYPPRIAVWTSKSCAYHFDPILDWSSPRSIHKAMVHSRFIPVQQLPSNIEQPSFILHEPSSFSFLKGAGRVYLLYILNHVLRAPSRISQEQYWDCRLLRNLGMETAARSDCGLRQSTEYFLAGHCC